MARKIKNFSNQNQLFLFTCFQMHCHWQNTWNQVKSRLISTDFLYRTSSISTQTRADSSSMTSCILPHQSVHRPEQTHHQWPPVSYLINQYRPEQNHHQWAPVSYIINQYTDQSRLIINDLLYLTSSISTQTRADSSSMTSCILPHQSVAHTRANSSSMTCILPHQSVHRPEQTHH